MLERKHEETLFNAIKFVFLILSKPREFLLKLQLSHNTGWIMSSDWSLIKYKLKCLPFLIRLIAHKNVKMQFLTDNFHAPCVSNSRVLTRIFRLERRS